MIYERNKRCAGCGKMAEEALADKESMRCWLAVRKKPRKKRLYLRIRPNQISDYYWEENHLYCPSCTNRAIEMIRKKIIAAQQKSGGAKWMIF